MRIRLVAAPIAALLALGACGGDGGEEAADDADRTADTTTSRGDGAGEADAPEATNGTGEIVIGGTTFAFTSESCAVGTGETPVVQVTGTGNSGGREYEVEIARSQPADNYVERVRLQYSGVEGAVATRIGTAERLAFEVDDRTVTASGLQFVGAGAAPSGEGSITVTCEDA